ncbi:OmpA family protein [Vibrio methylphosphonaticus]|uniref:OmpA family protein n=1 Tax=Vibrio methylphosphonaticus TaxID=2946866 RepID=UPI002029D05D|nr:OmpA family protein [Vibrio methylphosphonaticus]MCL9776707.1 OmpA family protein [Vibrio methylphosphonaticus]
MKLRNLLSLCSLVAFSVTATTHDQDEYDYIPVPLADQKADLIDNDSDGVINARDLCVITPEGSVIDNDGCEKYIDTTQSMAIRVLFDNNSTEIKSVFQRQIRQMAAFLNAYPETTIEIQGYASIVGNPEKNLVLSQNRADAVRQAIINNGISPDRLTIVGFGDTKPEELGSNEFSHAMNRKVVASVVGYKGEVEKQWTIFTKIDK